MDAEIRPEPQAEERDAILRAVEEQLVRNSCPSSHASPWHEQGIRENLDDGPLEEPG